MNERLTQLAEHRAALVAQAERQREQLVQTIVPWQKPLSLAERAVSGIRYIARQPALLAAGAVLFTILGPRSIFKWIQRGWLAWRVVRNIRQKLTD